MDAPAALARLLTPPLCVACGAACRPEDRLCESCATLLRRSGTLFGSPPPGLDAVFSAAPHDSIARDLLRALKFGRMPVVAGLIAGRIAALAPSGMLQGTLVPVPAAPLRLRWRGFDPAAEISLSLAALTGLPVRECLLRRGIRRQVGRPRRERLGQPPRIQPRGPAPPSAILLDDVLTTGATLTSCALALRRAGAKSVIALTFARRL